MYIYIPITAKPNTASADTYPCMHARMHILKDFSSSIDISFGIRYSRRMVLARSISEQENGGVMIGWSSVSWITSIS